MNSDVSSVYAGLQKHTAAIPSAPDLWARVALFDAEPDAVAAALAQDLPDGTFEVLFRSADEILVTFPGRRFRSDNDAFRLADILVERYARPEIGGRGDRRSMFLKASVNG